MDGPANTSPLLRGVQTEDESQSEDFSDSKPLFNSAVPRDHYFFAYFIFYLLGMTTLLPFNFFITADGYWMYKFRDTNQTDDNVTQRTPLQAEFESYISICSSAPTFVFYCVNTAVARWISFHQRMIGSLLAMLILFLITTILVNVNTDAWQHEFFLITMVSIVFLNVAGTVMGGTLFGIMGKFSPHYITASVGGQALGGIFASVAQIICLALGATATHSALIYFVIGCLTIIMSLVMYILMSRTLFFIHHTRDRPVALNELESMLLRREEVSYKSIVKKVWKYGTCLTLVFGVSLAVFPGITVLVESESKAPDSKWTNVYWVPTINYLLYNVGDYTGRLLAGLIQKPKSGNIQLLIALTRVISIPLIMLSNAQPREHMPVLLNKDWMYIIVIAVSSLTNGYSSNLAVIYTPLSVEYHEKETASTILTIFIGTGLIIGSSLCVIFVKLL